MRSGVGDSCPLTRLLLWLAFECEPFAEVVVFFEVETVVFFELAVEEPEEVVLLDFLCAVVVCGEAAGADKLQVPAAMAAKMSPRLKNR
jgi:hypothetical protein